MNILSQIVSWILLPVLAISGLFSPIQRDYSPEILDLKTKLEEQSAIAQRLGTQLTDIPVPVALFETSLQASISSSATSMTLVSATDKDGNTLASSTYAFIIDEGSADEEFVIGGCTGTTCQGLIRGVSVLTGTSTISSLAKAHRRGASVKITDAPLLLQLFRLANGVQGFPVPLFYQTEPTFDSQSTQFATVNFVEDTANAGAADASAIAKGLFEVADPTEASLTAAAGSGDTTAPLALHTGMSTSTPGTDDATSTQHYIPVTESNAKLNNNFLAFATTSSNNDNLAVNGNLLVGATTTTGNLFATGSVRVSGGEICNDTNCFSIGNIPSASNTQALDIFTANGTWTKPSGAIRVEVIAIGGGGGGGSGRNGSVSTQRSGGSGGSGGGMVRMHFNADVLGATETITVGQGGAAGAAQASADTDGNAGSNGTASTFGDRLRAGYGLGGNAGTSAASAGARNGAWSSDGFTASTTNASSGGGGTTGVQGGDNNASFAPRGGGGGGGIDSGNTSGTGGVGGGFTTDGILPSALAGGAGGSTSGGAGGNGNSRANKDWRGGTGGGGGGGTGGTGGAGGLYGGGGGGGGGGTSGAGGAGANGIIVVISYF